MSIKPAVRIPREEFESIAIRRGYSVELDEDYPIFYKDHFVEELWRMYGRGYVSGAALSEMTRQVNLPFGTPYGNKHTCDCKKNHGQECLHPEKYENEGCT